MIVLRQHIYSRQRILGTSGASGFIRGRKYDMDMNRLGRMNTTNQMTNTKILRDEMRKLHSELNRGFRAQDFKN